MSAVDDDWSKHDLASLLRQADFELHSGESKKERERAQEVMCSARERADQQIEARALLCLADCDRLVSRLRRSSDTSRSAALLFQRLNDVEGEAAALTLLAHVCTLLGRNEEAVEAAMFTVRLGELMSPRPQTVLAHNYLGVAYCWSGSFDEAQAALEAAAEVAVRCVPPVSVYQPRMNQAWAETVRLASERFHTGHLPSLEKLQAMVATYRRMEEVGDTGSVQVGLQVVGHALSSLLVALLLCWQGNFSDAHEERTAAHRWLERCDSPTWLSAFDSWVAAELAWAQHHWGVAEVALSQMTEMAGNVEHEQLACFGHLLAAQVFEQQGKHALAAREFRSLRRREMRIRAESLKSREGVVAWQLGARQNEQSLQRLQVVSKRFEQWSLEDALTGIANRRCLEHVLAKQLESAAATGQPLSVALIDVDKFKVVNDCFTHQVGDRVLKTLAGILAAHVRERDLAARLAGDEFVTMFAGADAQAAAQVYERIREAVASFKWESIAVGLHVTISGGVVQAVDGDTVESLLHRSDVSMYGAKQVPVHGGKAPLS